MHFAGISRHTDIRQPAISASFTDMTQDDLWLGSQGRVTKLVTGTGTPKIVYVSIHSPVVPERNVHAAKDPATNWSPLGKIASLAPDHVESLKKCIEPSMIPNSPLVFRQGGAHKNSLCRMFETQEPTINSEGTFAVKGRL